MTVSKEELQKIGEDSFNEWFNTWFENAELDEKLKKSASNGAYCLLINCNSPDIMISENRQMQKDEFVGNLRNHYPSLQIERTENEITVLMNKKKINEVKISWQN
ncbi:hypothetical protein MX633_09070 [Carnobacterium divergens]|uniref:hypothetical protein n=1 Tax=Carnobacterium divergens TaxID=2748 RepID=UPI00288D9FE4|nr:hypothetical protein [Carnobacterium divergens]MDT1996825.1 hypothetical protein [Carnobacterium divergens]